MEFKTMNFDYKLASDDRTFEGFGATYDRDLVNDTIQKGAFEKTINERFPKNQIKILWQHAEPLGIPTHIEENEKGLYIKGRISDTSLGRDALQYMKDGVVDTLSIGYDINDFEEKSDGRLLKDLTLYEVSLVTFPANPQATLESVGSIKSLNDMFKNFDPEEMKYFLKEGRVLSKANRGKIESCIKALQDVLNITDDQDNNKNRQSMKHTNETDQDAMKGFLNIFEEMKNYKNDFKK